MSDGTLVANWYPAVDFRLEAYDIRLSYSKDEGKTWARPLVPHHDKTRTQHGFVSLFEMPAGGLGLVWLDGRNQGKQPEDAEMAMYFASYRHRVEADRRSVRQRARLRVLHDVSRGHARRRGRGVPRSQSEGDPRHPRLASRERQVDRRAGRARGQLGDRRLPGQRTGAERARTSACRWRGSRARTTRARPSRRSRPTRGAPGARRSGSTIETSLGHVDVEMLDDGSAVATWVEFADDRSQFRMRRVEPSGMRSAAITINGAGRVSGYPRVARSGNELVFAWTEGSRGRGRSEGQRRDRADCPDKEEGRS